VVARGAAFAQNAAPSDVEKAQVLCLIEGTNLLVSVPAAEGATGIKKATAADHALIAQARPSWIKTFLDNTDLRASIRMLDLDLVEGLTSGAKYKYQVEKSNLRPNSRTPWIARSTGCSRAQIPPTPRPRPFDWACWSPG
jgi:hypothetical protein